MIQDSEMPEYEIMIVRIVRKLHLTMYIIIIHNYLTIENKSDPWFTKDQRGSDTFCLRTRIHITVHNLRQMHRGKSGMQHPPKNSSQQGSFQH